MAGLYNLIWGAIVVLFPYFFFDSLGLERPRYIELWQCIGMIVGVYGIGYLCAARDYVRHWPIVLVGLLGKIFGPIGFAISLYKGTLPIKFGAVIIFNDLIWWIPFTIMLFQAYRSQNAKNSIY